VKAENKILISCRDATRLEEMRREGKIAFTSRFALWLHLLYCKFCKRFIKQSALIEKCVGEMTQYERNYTLSGERKEAMKKALEQ